MHALAPTLRARLEHVATVSCSDARVQARRALREGRITERVVEHVERLLREERLRRAEYRRRERERDEAVSAAAEEAERRQWWREQRFIENL